MMRKVALRARLVRLRQAEARMARAKAVQAARAAADSAANQRRVQAALAASQGVTGVSTGASLSAHGQFSGRLATIAQHMARVHTDAERIAAAQQAVLYRCQTRVDMAQQAYDRALTAADDETDRRAEAMFASSTRGRRP